MLKGVVVGAGDRGANAYTPLLLAEPDAARVVAVAEPDPERRRAFGERYGVPEAARFSSWRALAAQGHIADWALVATPDGEHARPALALLEAGYDVLLEKPMATSEADCEALVTAADRTGRILQICHVLRYAPLFAAVKDVLDAGEIGRIVAIQHSENVSYFHYAHSYCRGSWRNRAASSPMILAKSCHDLDLLQWFAGAPPVRLVSVERPTELVAANAPPGAPERCIDGCPASDACPYDAVAMYRDVTPLLLDVKRRSHGEGGVPIGGSTGPDDVPKAASWEGWPVSVVTNDPSPAGVEHALRTSHYGRCVYRVGDNDQPSSQHVGVLFANGVAASFTMHGASYREGRELRIDGTRGSLTAGFYTLEQTLDVHDHKTGRTRRVDVPPASGTHGGADPKLFRAFLAAVRGDAAPMTSAAESLWSHRMAFAADRAAREGIVVEWSAAGGGAGTA
jgi:predicted dehydrogenase